MLTEPSLLICRVHPDPTCFTHHILLTIMIETIEYAFGTTIMMSQDKTNGANILGEDWLRRRRTSGSFLNFTKRLSGNKAFKEKVLDLKAWQKTGLTR